MRIAYVTSRQINFNDGVVKKMKMQVNHWISRGHQVQIYCNMPRLEKGNESKSIFDNVHLYKPTTSFPYISKWFPNKALINDLNNFRPDIVYLRFEHFSVYHSSIAKRFPIIMELNTNDLSEMKLLAGLSYRTRFNYYHHRLTRNVLFANVSGLVSVTHEIIDAHSVKKFNKPSVVIPNGIDLSDFPILDRSKTNERPTLVFIGMNNRAWHGVDKIIRLAKLAKNDLRIHVVGVDRPNMEIPENIYFHGFLPRTKYENILKESDVGIGTLALHRNGMNEACTLKVREYLAYGLPIIIGYSDTAFSGHHKPPWLLEISNEESNVENWLNEIILFARKMQGQSVPRHEIREFIDISLWEDRRLDFFNMVKGMR